MASSPEERDFSGMAATLSPEVKLRQSSGLPYPGDYIGPEGFQVGSLSICTTIKTKRGISEMGTGNGRLLR
jgi:hypothetical protein